MARHLQTTNILAMNYVTESGNKIKSVAGRKALCYKPNLFEQTEKIN